MLPVEFDRFLAGEIEMPLGTVKWFNTQKGFGFIQPATGGADVFVHIAQLEESGVGVLQDGQLVTYELIETRKGKMAAGNIKPAT